MNAARVMTEEMTIQTADIEISGVPAVCDPLGALFLPESQTLVVSDLHLEKGAAFARRGMMLPPYDTALTLQLLELVIGRYDPVRVISLGDSFHDRHGAAGLPSASDGKLRALISGREWFWIAGNHDPDQPADLEGHCVQELYFDGLCFRHEPVADPQTANGEIAGHLHPAARVVRRNKGVRRPCFATDGSRLVLPSFGVMTGGMNLRHPAFNGLFDRRKLTAHLLGRERIYSVPFDRLVG
ncbi:MAG: ligase-associated DNA damage response endonuclease PdeM [Alphaproteobacteria bacterium]|nr:ligase-associated DNA damage response endonuclease PdeM [Alphaproteobacteria bacterium]